MSKSTGAGKDTLVAAFPDHERAVEAAHALDEAGIAPDDVGLVAQNVRQAREAAGSFSVPGALVGAVVGVLIAVGFVAIGGEAMQHDIVAVAIGAPALIIALAAIGALAGRAKLWQAHDYEKYERIVGMGDALVTVSGDAAQLARARDVLKRRGATAIRKEDTGEAI